MASLKLVNKENIQYYEYRDILYYNEYKYKINFVLLGSNYLYHDENINSWARKVKNLSHNSIQFVNSRFLHIDEDTVIETILKNRSKIELFLKFKKGNRDKIKVRVENHYISIFTNNIEYIDELKSKFDNCTIVEAKANNDVGIKYFIKVPKYRYRTYFKNTVVSHEEKCEFEEYLSKNKDIDLSGSLSRFLKGGRFGKQVYFYNSFFIQYNDEHLNAVLKLMYGELLGRTFRLEPIRMQE